MEVLASKSRKLQVVSLELELEIKLLSILFRYIIVNAALGTLFETVIVSFAPLPLYPYPIIVTHGLADLWISLFNDQVKSRNLRDQENRLVSIAVRLRHSNRLKFGDLLCNRFYLLVCFNVRLSLSPNNPKARTSGIRVQHETLLLKLSRSGSDLHILDCHSAQHAIVEKRRDKTWN